MPSTEQERTVRNIDVNPPTHTHPAPPTGVKEPNGIRGGTISLVFQWSRMSGWCSSVDAVYCPWLAGAVPIPSSLFPDRMCPSSWCHLPIHRYIHEGARNNSMIAAFYRCRSMPAFWWSTICSLFPCTEYLCWHSSLVYNPAPYSHPWWQVKTNGLKSNIYCH